MIKKIWKFFCSVKLTVVLFVLILIPSVIGTVILQDEPDPARYVEIYGPTWNGIFRFLGFYDIYHDSRFIILIVMLGLNTFACTVNRFRAKWNIVGMLMTHVGLILILIGALVGATMGLKGFMAIDEGKIGDRMRIGQAIQSADVLPFQLKLVDFILDTHDEPTHTLWILDEKTGEQEPYKLEQGKTVPLSKPRWAGPKSLLGIKPEPKDTVTANQFFSHADMVVSLSEGPEQTGASAAEFRLVNGGNESQGFVLSQIDHPFMLQSANLAVGYAELTEPGQLEEKIQLASSLFRTTNSLEIIIPEQDTKMIVPAEIGSEFIVKGTDYSIKILRYVPDFMMDFSTREVVSKSEIPNNPALNVDVVGPNGTSNQWFFAKFPSMHETGDLPFEVAFHVHGNLSSITDYVLVAKVVEGESDNEIKLAHIRDAKLVSSAGAAVGQSLDIEGTGYSIIVDRLFKNANMSNKLVDRPETSDKKAVEITIKRGDTSNSYSLFEDTPIDMGDHKAVYQRNDKIRDFYSILQVIDDGQVTAEKKIEVNDPLRYKGYAFYQASYDTKNLNWTGLQVKKDPGVPLVYAGFLMQILGMIVIFYVNPLIRKAKKSKA